ncbi:MAG: glycosyltransferase [Geminicoccaceae bacterium]|nr:glycosyltransferase [Geminicoccaceae bacterium]
MRIAFFGSSLLSAYWNGAATYYRGLIRALAAHDHEVTFFEPDAFDRQAHRDIDPPPWACSVVYPADEAGVGRALAQACGADVLVKASGVGVFDDVLENAVIERRRPGQLALFWDVDAPATLERMQSDEHDPLRRLVPRYDLILTYGGGDPVIQAYRALGARACVPVYNALDPSSHFPVPAEARFAADLSFVGNRLPDREERVDEFFFAVARRLPERAFLIGGSGWEDKDMPENVRPIGHVFTTDHNALNSSALAVLNVNRASMARFGHSPPTRLFEAVGADACLITDAWPGIERFLEPGREVLTAEDGREVAERLRHLSRREAKLIGEAGRARLLSEHTYAHRAAEVDRLLEGRDRGQAA